MSEPDWDPGTLTACLARSTPSAFFPNDLDCSSFVGIEVKFEGEAVGVVRAAWVQDNAVYAQLDIDLRDHRGEAVMSRPGLFSPTTTKLPATTPLPRCKACGCLDYMACVHSDGRSCSWADAEKTICTACVPQGQGGIWTHPPRKSTDSFLDGYGHAGRYFVDPAYHFGVDVRTNEHG